MTNPIAQAYETNEKNCYISDLVQTFLYLKTDGLNQVLWLDKPPSYLKVANKIIILR